jgi:hypothetical protein
MQINWCLKGIQENSQFGDTEASSVLTNTGILSTWMLRNGRTSSDQANIDSQNALSARALYDHVNAYWLVRNDTPYISLSAGCVEFTNAATPPIRYAAVKTALDFATDGGRTSGYIFRCWVLTSLNACAELPGFAEEVRDLNLFAGYYAFHNEGEVAAKLVVPRRQIQWVQKVDKDLQPIAAFGGTSSRALRNVDFLRPERLSNIVREI